MQLPGRLKSSFLKEQHHFHGSIFLLKLQSNR